MRTSFAVAAPFATLALFLFTGAFLYTARAAATSTIPAPQPIDCSIKTTDLDQISAAAAQGLSAELAARKALLTRTISCAKGEAQALADQVNGLPGADADSQSIQTQFLGKLTDASNYYDIELGKVNDAGIAGTQAIAKEVLAWRGANFAPLSGEIADFALWEKNQNLFKIANGRLNQTKAIASFLEQAGPSSDLANAVSAAQASMEQANNQNVLAKNSLLQFASPDVSLLLIQQSLQSLADAYQKFADISTIVQKLLTPGVTAGQGE